MSSENNSDAVRDVRRGCGCVLLAAFALLGGLAMCGGPDDQLAGSADVRVLIPWLVDTDLHKGTAADWMTSTHNEKMTVAGDSLIVRERMKGNAEPDVFSSQFRASVEDLVRGIDTACATCVELNQESMPVSEIVTSLFVIMDSI